MSFYQNINPLSIINQEVIIRCFSINFTGARSAPLRRYIIYSSTRRGDLWSPAIKCMTMLYNTSFVLLRNPPSPPTFRRTVVRRLIKKALFRVLFIYAAISVSVNTVSPSGRVSKISPVVSSVTSSAGTEFEKSPVS